MAETANIATIAQKVSDLIFSPFGWSLSGPTNANFPCEKTEAHRKETSPTHPVDSVLQYDDPYEARRNYLITDLKSYAKGSLDPTRLKGALRDLAKAVDCAAVSANWRTRWANDEEQYNVNGLLFVFNHDNLYDKDFDVFFQDEATKKLDLPRLSKLFVFGPKRISYLLTLLNDLRGLVANREFPFFTKVPFLYPDRIQRFAKQNVANVARVELLMGPWQIIPFDFVPTSLNVEVASSKVGYKIYYSGSGQDSAEFEFFFDFCFRHQLVKDNVTLDIRMPFASDNAMKTFGDAKENFARNFYSSPDIMARLAQFSVSPIQSIVQNISIEHVGMERR